jgi:hypothetical protein
MNLPESSACRVIGSLIVAADASLVRDKHGMAAVDGIRIWADRRGLAVPQDVYRMIERYPEVLRPMPNSVTYVIRARAIGRGQREQIARQNRSDRRGCCRCGYGVGIAARLGRLVFPRCDACRTGRIARRQSTVEEVPA